MRLGRLLIEADGKVRGSDRAQTRDLTPKGVAKRYGTTSVNPESVLLELSAGPATTDCCRVTTSTWLAVQLAGSVST